MVTLDRTDWAERNDRVAVRLVASVERPSGARENCSVRDLSLEGCRLIGDYGVGDRISVEIEQLGKLRGQVRWSVLGSAGVRFEEQKHRSLPADAKG